MTADELRAFITAVPFRPFHVRTVDGRRLPVYNRDFILITPSQTHVYVFQPNDAYEVLDIAILPSVEFSTPPAEAKPKASDTAA